jgi:tetratricopeptide (TPR) repeat protein
VKRVNLKLLLTLVAATVIAVVGVYFLRRFQITRNAGGLAKLARQRLDEGKPAEALLLFQRYVGLRPEDKEAYGEYAELLLRKTEGPEVTRADLARAYAVLEEAIRRDPANDALRARLARFQLRIGRFGDAREHLRVLREHVADGTIAAASAAAEPAAEKADVDALTDPDSIALMLARAHLGMGEFEPAATIAGELVGFDLESRSFGDEPQTGAPTDAYVVLAAILAEKLEDTAAANRVLDQLVKVRPDDATAWLALSRWHRQQGDAAAATRDLDKALELGPDNPDVLFAAFDLCAATGDASRAETSGATAPWRASVCSRGGRTRPSRPCVTAWPPCRPGPRCCSCWPTSNCSAAKSRKRSRRSPGSGSSSGRRTRPSACSRHASSSPGSSGCRPASGCGKCDRWSPAWRI